MSKYLLVGFMLAAAVAIGALVHFFTGSVKWALGVAGVCLAIDLTFAPWIKRMLDQMNRK